MGKWLRRIGLGLVVLYLAVGGLVFVFQRKLVFHPRATFIAPQELGIQAVQLTSAGNKLNGWYLPPKAGPVFLYLDGNGGAPDRWPLRWREIAAGGAGFLDICYRGYSGSSGTPTEIGLIEDARAAYDWLIAQGYRPRDIVIHGMSLGTGVAVQLAVDHSARALILEAPFTAAVDVAAHDFPWLPVRLMMWDQFRSRDYIARIHVPILIAHGTRDHTIPFTEGRELFSLANQPKSFVAMPGSDHITLVKDGLYPHIWDFLEHHPPTMTASLK